VNKFTDEALEAEDVFPIDPELQKAQIARTQSVRGARQQAGWRPPWPTWPPPPGDAERPRPRPEALKRMATLGEVSDVLREVFGVYQPGR